MIEGTDIADQFENIYASSYLYDVNGVAEWPAVAIDYTAYSIKQSFVIH